MTLQPPTASPTAELLSLTPFTFKSIVYGLTDKKLFCQARLKMYLRFLRHFSAQPVFKSNSYEGLMWYNSQAIIFTPAAPSWVVRPGVYLIYEEWLL